MDVNNNKKRSLEISSIPLNNINENGIEKTFNDKYNEFINKDYDSFNLAEIKKYAEELGISNKGRKHEIHERIEQYLLSQISTIKEIIESEEINPFNKGEIQLLIKEIPKTERLFWSIFRNKPIFKEIFSHFKYKRSFTYERLNDPHIILSYFSNGLEILKDKIKCNNHLNPRFYGLTKFLRKDTTENRQFLNQIFQKYSNVISKEVMAERSLEQKNLFLLKFLNVNNKILKVYKVPIYRINDYRTLKVVDYLNEVGIPLKLSEDYVFSKSFSIFLDFKLKHLIYLIDKLPIFLKLDRYTFNLYKDSKSSISKCNISFTNEQLHSTIFQLLCHHSEIIIKDENTINNNNNNNNNSGSGEKDDNKSLKSNIYKYVKVFYQIFLSKDKEFMYYLLFKDINRIKSKMVSGTSKSYKCLAYDFFKIFKLKKNMHYDLINYPDGYTKSDVYVEFERFVIKRNDLELIQLVFEKYGKINNFKESLLLTFDINYFEIYSIDFLNYYFNNHQDSTNLFKDNNGYFSYVTDLPTLLHYEKLMVKLGRKFLMEHRYFFSDEVLPFGQVFTRALLNPDAYLIPQNFYFRLMPCPKFKFEHLITYLKTGHTNFLKFSEFENNNFLNQLLENHLKSPITEIDQIIDCENSIYKIRFCEKENCERTPGLNRRNFVGNLEKNGKVLIEVEIDNLFNFLYANGRYEEIFQINNSNNWIFAEFFDSREYFSKEFIDLLFSHGFKDGKIVNQNFYPCEIIDKIISGNNLYIFKLLTLKYNFLFNQKSKSNPNAIFDTKQLKEFLKRSIRQSHVEIAELLLNYISITKSEYLSITSKDCPIFKHLYNKFK